MLAESKIEFCIPTLTLVQCNNFKRYQQIFIRFFI